MPNNAGKDNNSGYSGSSAISQDAASRNVVGRICLLDTAQLIISSCGRAEDFDPSRATIDEVKRRARHAHTSDAIESHAD
jgi:hypothetical protein